MARPDSYLDVAQQLRLEREKECSQENVTKMRQRKKEELYGIPERRQRNQKPLDEFDDGVEDVVENCERDGQIVVGGHGDGFDVFVTVMSCFQKRQGKER